MNEKKKNRKKEIITVLSLLEYKMIINKIYERLGPSKRTSLKAGSLIDKGLNTRDISFFNKSTYPVSRLSTPIDISGYI